jgi:SAM-dependent methyltransferase
METRTVGLAELGLADAYRVDHVPSFWKTLPRILSPHDVGSDDVFLEVGSGMGRVVVLAARKYSFRRIIGVEISGDLHKIAERNVARNYHRLRCRDVELVNADILDYQIPDDVSVVYLYNPFLGPIFQHFAEELQRSVSRRPRKVRIIYLTPREEGRLLAWGNIRRVRTARVVRGDRSLNSVVRLYELAPNLDE